MTAHSICKVSRAGIGYSIVELNDVRHVFAVAVPRSGATLREQAGNALQTIAAAIGSEDARNSVVQQAVFVADAGLIDECRGILREFYGGEMPATSYIPQRPCEGKLLSIEALGLGQGKGSFEIQRISEQLVVARHNGIAWIHAALAAPQPSVDGVYRQATDAFEQLQALFCRAGAHFDQVIRTWLYLGGNRRERRRGQEHLPIGPKDPTGKMLLSPFCGIRNSTVPVAISSAIFLFWPIACRTGSAVRPIPPARESAPTAAESA